MVVIGLVAILVALLLPALGGAFATGKTTRDMAALRDASILVSLYAQDHSGVFPLDDPTESLNSNALRWVVPMVRGGYAKDITEIDHRSDQDGVGFSMLMSAAMVYDWRLMRPGHTVLYNEARPRAVSVSSVTFPSLKGLLFRAENEEHDALNGRPIPSDVYAFCCVEQWVFPVVNADSSVIRGDWKFFNGGRPLYEENYIGTPVLSTWHGVKGQDR